MGNLPVSNATPQGKKNLTSLVLCCLLRKKMSGKGGARFCLIRKQGHMNFPLNKFRPGEALYLAMVRPLEEDLGLPTGSFFLERELEMIPNEGTKVRYPGFQKRWFLYPVDFSLTDDAWTALQREMPDVLCWTISEILTNTLEPNVLAIAGHINSLYPELLKETHPGPSMEALAGRWAARNDGGVRVVRSEDIRPRFWLTPQGLGTVIKAAGEGELAGVGKIIVTNKIENLF